MEINEVGAGINTVRGTLFQIIPVKTSMPEKVVDSKDAAHYFRNRIRMLENRSDKPEKGARGSNGH